MDMEKTYIDQILLSKEHKSFLINEFKNGNTKAITISNEYIENSLRLNQLIEIDIDEYGKTFRLTDRGKLYCELEIEKEQKEKKDNIIKWISLIVSLLAIVTSICSLIIQFASYHNDKIDIKSEPADITNEMIEIIISTDIGKV